jgi:hypothetical protein|tara:strand:- start:184 stop:432 length:249 start_codon:yes stop_codon:yes gene_type:complete
MENVLKLQTPIVLGSETITELVFEEVKAKHMLEIKQDMSFADILKITASLTNQPLRAVIYNLSAKDTKKAVEKTSFLLAGGE